MARRMVFITIASLALPAIAQAQVMFDTKKVTCAYYLAMQPNDARLLSAFMSGWAHQKGGEMKVDLNDYDRKIVQLRGWCATNPNEPIISRFQTM
jgi:HdeA/HdeB family